MSQALSHPAIAVAVESISGYGGEFEPVAAIIKDDVVGVVLDSDEARFTVIVQDREGVWTPPTITVGSPRPTEPRQTRTQDYMPLQRLNRKRFGSSDRDGARPEFVWFCITGLAAEDAAEVSIVVDGHEHTEPIGAAGLAFAIARMHRDDQPEVYVRTQDGRRIAA